MESVSVEPEVRTELTIKIGAVLKTTLDNPTGQTQVQDHPVQSIMKAVGTQAEILSITAAGPVQGTGLERLAPKVRFIDIIYTYYFLFSQDATV